MSDSFFKSARFAKLRILLEHQVCYLMMRPDLMQESSKKEVKGSVRKGRKAGEPTLRLSHTCSGVSGLIASD